MVQSVPRPAVDNAPPKKCDLKGRVLLIDDETLILRALTRILANAGHSVETAPDGATAMKMIGGAEYDVVFTDINMPGIGGIELIRMIREAQHDVPVVILTGNPQVETAMEAVEHGALRYLVKPIDADTLHALVSEALQRSRTNRLQKRAIELLGDAAPLMGQRDLESSFMRGIELSWMAYQPIVCLKTKTVYAYEALVRTKEPAFPNPGVFFSVAERLSKLDVIGRAVRNHVAVDFANCPSEQVFVNLHARDLLDDHLIDPKSPLTQIARSVVLEITERSDLERVVELRSRIQELRQLGYRIAVDDLGAGYAGLNSIAMLEPEVVKLDMTLVRDVHKELTKRKIVKAMSQFCEEIGALVVAEGVETKEELDSLVSLGCTLFQGYYFSKPGPNFPTPKNL